MGQKKPNSVRNRPSRARGAIFLFHCSFRLWAETAARLRSTVARPKMLPPPPPCDPGRNLGLGRESSFAPGPFLAWRGDESFWPSDRIRRFSGRFGGTKPADHRLPPETLLHFFPLPSPPLLCLASSDRAHESSEREPRRPSATVGPLAGKRAPLVVSTLPSSGLATVPRGHAQHS